MAEVTEIALAAPRELPVGPVGRHGIGYWGVGTLVASEGVLFGYLLFVVSGVLTLRVVFDVFRRRR